MSQNKFYGNIGIFKLYNFFLLCQIIVPCITSTSQPKVKSVYLVFLLTAEHSRLQRRSSIWRDIRSCCLLDYIFQFMILLCTGLYTTVHFLQLCTVCSVSLLDDLFGQGMSVQLNVFSVILTVALLSKLANNVCFALEFKYKRWT